MRGVWIGLAAAGLGVFAAISFNKADSQIESEAAAKILSVIEVTQSGNEEGRTVVLIPGLASSAAVWDETRAALEPDYDVRTVQVAGFAGAAPLEVEGAYSDAIAEALAVELGETPGKETVLVGHSLGGFVAMKTALASPDLIDEPVETILHLERC